jgi:MFS family permease
MRPDGTTAPTSRALLRSRCFAPLFWTQFLGGYNDNFFKQAMPLYVGYRLSTGSGLDPAALTALASATFVAPFVLLSALAGRVADIHDKALLARRLKLVEVFLMCGATVGLLTQSLPTLFAVLLLLGTQATFFGPVKYSLLPTHLAENELMLGNALVEGATFIAILMGNVLGGLLSGVPDGLSYVAAGLITLSALGYFTARWIPPAPPPDADQRISFNVFADTVSLLREARAQRCVWLSIVGISWFWTFGAMVLALMQPVARDVLGGAEGLASLFLATFSIGIGVGSVACARYFRGRITPAPVPLAALTMSVLLLGFAAVLTSLPLADAHELGLWEACARPGTLPLLALVFLLSASSGFYAVPLYSILQHDAPAASKARMIGANNVANALMLIAGAVVLTALSSLLRVSVAAVTAAVAVLNLLAAALAAWALFSSPQRLQNTQ